MNTPENQQRLGRERNMPGAMTMAMAAAQIKPSGPKVLRIGVIQGGKIIEERVLRKRETVSVGSSERATFVLQSPSLPPKFDLFQLVGNDYILNFTADMRGRVGLPAGVKELAELRSTGAARSAGDYWQVKLTDSSRGKVVIGDTTLLFQFVSPPPVQPRPQLPAAARGGMVKGIDWVFTAFVLFSFMSHFGFVVYLESADWPIDTGMEYDPNSLAARMIFETPPEPEEEKPEETGDTGEAEEQQAEQRPKQGPKAADEGGGGKSESAEAAAEAQARIVEETAQAAEQLLLGALSSADGGGALADVLRGGGRWATLKTSWLKQRVLTLHKAGPAEHCERALAAAKAVAWAA
ncbi:MAG: hypothetical protein IPJ88_13640 [Myxococcales bacterium]|nr:MAG: hypothetical protein IPJ88_13640 [Myxococcales bacterium]